MKVALLTVSDRAAAGDREDRSGPILRSIIERQGWRIVEERIVPDEPAHIKEQLITWADEGIVDLILTTGGTGFSPRDNTPEATIEVCERMAPGLAEAMRSASQKITHHAMLSRAVAGIRQRTLIINLPGSPKGAKENLEVVLPALSHAVQLLKDPDIAEQGHQSSGKRKQL
jgi:molybdenum cofactor synthesis domain-containing protein